MARRSNAIRLAPIPLPARREDLVRRVKTERSIVDYAEDVFKLLYDDPEFRKWVDAVYDETAITGKLDFDYYNAAKLMQAKAEDMGYAQLVEVKDNVVVKSLRGAMRRQSVDAKSRRRTAVPQEDVYVVGEDE